MLQNPHYCPWHQAPSLVQGPLTSAALPDQAQFNVGETSPVLRGNVTVGKLRDNTCCR